MDINTKLLEKLGEAYYCHKKEAELAKKAEESVDYFAGLGIFSDEEIESDV